VEIWYILVTSETCASALVMLAVIILQNVHLLHIHSILSVHFSLEVQDVRQSALLALPESFGVKQQQSII
jgi:hypothetical protein